MCSGHIIIAMCSWVIEMGMGMGGFNLGGYWVLHPVLCSRQIHICGGPLGGGLRGALNQSTTDCYFGSTDEHSHH